MIRPLRLRPRQVKSLRNWAIELAIVVVGVLLALWLAQWAEDRAQAKQDALIEEAVHREYLRNIGAIGQWRGLGKCHREQIVYLRDLLRDSGEDWPGMNRRAVMAGDDEDRIFPGFYTLFSGAIESEDWDAAVRSGTVGRMEPQKRVAYSSAFAVFESFGYMMDQATEARAGLGALVYPGKLSPSDRIAALNGLIALDGSREYIMRPRQFAPIELNASERARMIERLKDADRMLRNIGAVRPCFTGSEIPDVFLDRE